MALIVELPQHMSQGRASLGGHNDRDCRRLVSKDRFPVCRRRIRVEPLGGFPRNLQVSRGGTAIGSFGALACLAHCCGDYRVVTAFQR
jgi:hypothetical protein